jgi:hypothetical protein
VNGQGDRLLTARAAPVLDEKTGTGSAKGEA